MFAALAVATIASIPQDARLAELQVAVPFHLYLMPDSAMVERVTVLASNAAGRPTDVRVVYRLSHTTLTVEETQNLDGSPSPNDLNVFIVNGYPASFDRTGPYYRPEGHLTWWPEGVTVTLTSTDLVDAPALVNSALSLR